MNPIDEGFDPNNEDELVLKYTPTARTYMQAHDELVGNGYEILDEWYSKAFTTFIIKPNTKASN